MFLMPRTPPISTLFPYTTLFRSRERASGQLTERQPVDDLRHRARDLLPQLGEVVPLARVPAAPALRLERRAGALDGAKDVADGDLLGRTREMVAAGGSPLGREELRALQREQ